MYLTRTTRGDVLVVLEPGDLARLINASLISFSRTEPYKVCVMYDQEEGDASGLRQMQVQRGEDSNQESEQDPVYAHLHQGEQDSRRGGEDEGEKR